MSIQLLRQLLLIIIIIINYNYYHFNNTVQHEFVTCTSPNQQCLVSAEFSHTLNSPQCQ